MAGVGAPVQRLEPRGLHQGGEDVEQLDQFGRAHPSVRDPRDPDGEGHPVVGMLKDYRKNLPNHPILIF